MINKENINRTIEAIRNPPRGVFYSQASHYATIGAVGCAVCVAGAVLGAMLGGKTKDYERLAVALYNYDEYAEPNTGDMSAEGDIVAGGQLSRKKAFLLAKDKLGIDEAVARELFSFYARVYGHAPTADEAIEALERVRDNPAISSDEVWKP